MYDLLANDWGDGRKKVTESTQEIEEKRPTPAVGFERGLESGRIREGRERQRD